MSTPEIVVSCYAGYRGDETPRSFRLAGRSIEVREIVRAWREPGLRFFRVRGDDELSYVLCHDEAADRWDIV